MLVQALGSQPLFFLEAALDRGYLGELLSRATRLPREDLESVIALVQQEADIFHLMLVARGRFHDHLDPPRLLAQHVAGTRLPRARLAAMLNDSSLSAAMRRAVGRALDIAVPDQAGDEVELAAHIETLAWNRYRRLANRAFRCGHLGWGAIVGYVGLRRIETANFMTLSEGVRQGVEPDTLHARMIPRVREEVDHV
jgi:vacuolar-type H+-ATPase subunit C/Vma6